MKLQKSAIASKAVKVSVVEAKKEIGRAYLYLIKNSLHKRPYGLMEDVFVDPAFRKHGLGSRMIKEIFKEAKKRKCYKLIATSRINRPKVHRLYTRFGFKKHGFEFRIDFK